MAARRRANTLPCIGVVRAQHCPCTFFYQHLVPTVTCSGPWLEGSAVEENNGHPRFEDDAKINHTETNSAAKARVAGASTLVLTPLLSAFGLMEPGQALRVLSCSGVDAFVVLSGVKRVPRIPRLAILPFRVSVTLQAALCTSQKLA